MYRRYVESKADTLQHEVEVLDDVLDELERLRAGGHHDVASKMRRCTQEEIRMLTAQIELGQVDKQTLIQHYFLVTLESLLSENSEGYLVMDKSRWVKGAVESIEKSFD